jgi:hypothetical protein
MADVKTISGCLQDTEHPLPKSQFRFGLGIMSWRIRNRTVMAVPVEMKEIMLLLTSLRTRWNAGNQKIFF